MEPEEEPMEPEEEPPEDDELEKFPFITWDVVGVEKRLTTVLKERYTTRGYEYIAGEIEMEDILKMDESHPQHLFLSIVSEILELVNTMPIE